MNTPGGRSIQEIGYLLRSGQMSCETLVQDVLQDIEIRDDYLGAFTAVTAERACMEAARAQRELESGKDRGPLHGIPYAIKDLFDVVGQPNSAGTPLLNHHLAKNDAAVVADLAAAGAVLVGRTQSCPLAATILGINHACGTPHNPWKKEAYIPGGSSSGSAVAVAAGLVPFALGTDSGGSVRVPAALCGAVGFKAAAGHISMRGVWPLEPVLDSLGWLTRSVADAGLVYTQLQESSPVEISNLKGMRIGICETVCFDEVDPEVAASVRAAASLLTHLGANVESVCLPEVAELHALAQEISLIAARAYPKYQEIVENPASDWVIHWLKVAKTYSRESVTQARTRRDQLMAELAERTRALDAWVAPTVPLAAVPVRDCKTPEAHAAMSARFCRNTLIGNLAGWCGVSLPCGLTEKGLPIGFMICAGAGSDARLLQMAQAFEKGGSWTAKTRGPPFAFTATP